MDASSFDAWTRRRFGLALGGGVTALLGLAHLDEAAAKKGKKRCRKVQQGCKPGGQKKRCCKGLECGEILGLGGNHCCNPAQGKCSEADECCGNFICDDVTGLEGLRCCSANTGACEVDQDCCEGFSCDDQTHVCG